MQFHIYQCNFRSIVSYHFIAVTNHSNSNVDSISESIRTEQHHRMNISIGLKLVGMISFQLIHIECTSTCWLEHSNSIVNLRGKQNTVASSRTGWRACKFADLQIGRSTNCDVYTML